MPYLVNGQIVPEQVIREEFDRVARDPFWRTISDEGERARRMRLASEASAADRILIEQLSTSDPRPIDLSALEQETERLRTHSGCRSQLDDPLLQQFVERQLRVQRFRAELVADAGRPEPEEVEAFYNVESYEN